MIVGYEFWEWAVSFYDLFSVEAGIIGIEERGSGLLLGSYFGEVPRCRMVCCLRNVSEAFSFAFTGRRGLGWVGFDCLRNGGWWGGVVHLAML